MVTPGILPDLIEEAMIGIVAEDMTKGQQARFAAITNRLLESDEPADQWLGKTIMIELADAAIAQYQAEQEGRVWSMYCLGRVGDTACFYVGISRDVEARYKTHVAAARCATDRAGSQCPVSRRIRAELEPNGPGVWVETILSGLTEAMAKRLETTMVTEMVKQGTALENGNLLGRRGPANRYPRGTPEYDEANREYQRQRLANDPEYRAAGQDASREYKRQLRSTPEGLEQCRAATRKCRSTLEGHTRSLASKALLALKNGGSLTPKRQQHIESAGFVDKAKAILAARGEVWPD